MRFLGIEFETKTKPEADGSNYCPMSMQFDSELRILD